MAAPATYSTLNFHYGDGMGSNQFVKTFSIRFSDIPHIDRQDGVMEQDCSDRVLKQKLKRTPEDLLNQRSRGLADTVAENKAGRWQHPPLNLNAKAHDGREPWYKDTSLDERFSHPPITPKIFTEPTPFHERSVSPGPLSSHQAPPAKATTPPPPPSAEIYLLADTIKALARDQRNRKAVAGLPSRSALKREDDLKGEVGRKTGCLTQGGKLRKYYGDTSLFTMEMWRYLTEEKYLREVKKEERKPYCKHNLFDDGDARKLGGIPATPDGPSSSRAPLGDSDLGSAGPAPAIGNAETVVRSPTSMRRAGLESDELQLEGGTITLVRNTLRQKDADGTEMNDQPVGRSPRNGQYAGRGSIDLTGESESSPVIADSAQNRHDHARGSGQLTSETMSPPVTPMSSPRPGSKRSSTDGGGSSSKRVRFAEDPVDEVAGEELRGSAGTEAGTGLYGAMSALQSKSEPRTTSTPVTHDSRRRTRAVVPPHPVNHPTGPSARALDAKSRRDSWKDAIVSGKSS